MITLSILYCGVTITKYFILVVPWDTIQEEGSTEFMHYLYQLRGMVAVVVIKDLG
jgi:hypothetical protein